MPCYFDSSVVLNVLLQQPEAAKWTEVWDRETNRLSSILLEAECITVLRRAAALQPKRDAGRFLAAQLEALNAALKGITLRTIDEEVLRCLSRDDRLGGCRTLDALHLATALLFQEHSDGDLVLATADERMKALAQCLDLAVL